MDMNYSGTEKGLKLNPRGVDHYSSLLQSTSLLINEDQDADAEKINFSISERSELLESPPIINIVPDQECLNSLKDKSLSIAVIIKEQSSRTSQSNTNNRLDAIITETRYNSLPQTLTTFHSVVAFILMH